MDYTYDATLHRVIDGDTVDLNVHVKVDAGFRLFLDISPRIRFRLAGIDTPEIRGIEKADGLKSKAFVQDVLSKASRIQVQSFKDPGKYGRWLGIILYWTGSDQCPINLNEQLLQEGLAEPYGDTKE